MTPLISEIRDLGGAPALFINGAPHTGLMFWHSRWADAGPDIANFARCGVDFFTTGIGATNGWREDGTFDFSNVDTIMRGILDANPNALVLPRVWVEPPAWWLARYPDEGQEHRDLGNGDPFHWRVSFASQRWREAIREPLERFIAYCEAHYADRMWGYHLCAGDCGEWSYAWKSVASDFSAPQAAGFRAWLRARYGSDAALQAAWRDTSVTLATAAVPTARTRPANAWPRVWSLNRPGDEGALIDYRLYHSEVVADAAIDLCRMAKTSLAALDRQKVVGIFYGYHFFDVGAITGLNAGHDALAAVLAAPEVDFICAPESYQERQPGRMFLPQLATGSLRLHGKLFYNEDDTFTHHAKPTPWRYVCPDADTTAHLLRRNLLGVLQDGGTYWWMDHDGDGWYRDDTLLAEVTGLAALTARTLDGPRHAPAQVAVIVSETSRAYLKHDTALVDALVARQMSELTSLGAPFDIYLTSDLARVFAGDTPYRLVVFLDALALSEDERVAIRDHVARDGRTLVWPYAAGLCTPDGLSVDAMAAVTGIRTQLLDWVGPLKVEAFLDGARHSYGTNAEVGPWLAGDDPTAAVWGWHLHRGQPGLLTQAMPGWRSVWSAAPALPTAVLRRLAREAGVHLYSEADDVVYALPGLLAVHTACPGTRTISLRAPAVVCDAFTGAVVADGASFSLTAARGETHVWRLA
jgi:hypothetical protein